MDFVAKRHKEESAYQYEVSFLFPTELGYSLQLMSDWLILLVVVPAIVVPIVLLFGFAGCSFTHGLLRSSPSLYEGYGVSETEIYLKWTYPEDAKQFEVQRSRAGDATIEIKHTPEPPHVWFPKGPTVFHDKSGLQAGKTYKYQVSALIADDDVWGPPSHEIEATTLIAEFPPVGQPTALPNDSQSWEGQTLVQRIEPSQLAFSGKRLVLTLRGPTAGEVTIIAISISRPDENMDPYDSVAADLTTIIRSPDKLKLQAGVWETVTVDVSYELDNTKPLLIAFAFDSNPAALPYRDVTLEEATAYACPGDQALVANRNAAGGEYRVYLIEKIQIEPKS